MLCNSLSNPTDILKDAPVKPLKFLAILIISLSLMLGLALTCQATTFVWVGGDGNWSVIANWECDPPSLHIPGPPGPEDTAVVHAGSPHIDRVVNVTALTVDADGQVIIETSGGLNAPDITNDGLISVASGASLAPGSSSTTLNGSGSVVLLVNSQYGCSLIGGGSGILTNGSFHTIRGSGNISMHVQNYGCIIAEQIDENTSGLELYYGCTGSSQSVLGAKGGNGSLRLTGNAAEYSGGHILPQDGSVIINNGSFSNVTFGPGKIGDSGGMGSYFYGGVTFAQGAQATFSLPMNILDSSGNTVSLTNNGTITANGLTTPNIATFTGTGTLSIQGGVGGAGVGGSFINDVGHTVRFNGELDCDLTNHGTLIAVGLRLYGHLYGAGPVIVENSLSFASNSSGASLQAGDLSMNPGAQLLWYADGTIDVKKNFSFSMTPPYGFSSSSGGNFQMSGGGANLQTLEVGGWDYGLESYGFSGDNHFILPQLSLFGVGTYVSLVDNIDNGSWVPGHHEALYLNASAFGANLSVPPGTTLNLNNLHLYVYLDGVMHQVKAGEGNLFGGGEIIDRPLKPVPLTGILMPLLLGD